MVIYVLSHLFRVLTKQTNRDHMKLTVLGSGTCVPSLTRSAPGYLLAAGGCQLLVDIGSTALQQLVRANQDYLQIDTIFITHTHPDHVSGLLPFLHASTSTPGRSRTRDLTIIGPRGIQEFYDCCIGSLLSPLQTFCFTIKQMPEHLSLESLRVASITTKHTEASIAYRFFGENRSVVFTGDCDFDNNLITFSQGADLLVIDCSYPNDMKTAGHLTPKECGTIAREAGVRQVLLTHIYPTRFPDEQRVEECRAVFSGIVLLAYDLLEIDIR